MMMIIKHIDMLIQQQLKVLKKNECVLNLGDSFYHMFSSILKVVGSKRMFFSSGIMLTLFYIFVQCFSVHQLE